MKYQSKPVNPRKEHISVTFCGGSQSATPLTLLGPFVLSHFQGLPPKTQFFIA